MTDDTTTNEPTTCKHGQLARSCEICEMKEALDAAIEERDTYRKRCNELSEALGIVTEDRDRLYDDVRDEYAQAALTGLLSRYGAEKIWREMVSDAFEIADLAMARRKQR